MTKKFLSLDLSVQFVNNVRSVIENFVYCFWLKYILYQQHKLHQYSTTISIHSIPINFDQLLLTYVRPLLCNIHLPN